MKNLIKTAFFILVFFHLSSHSFATIQESDYLIFNDIKYKVHTDWVFPSPVERYFYDNHIEYPFKSISSGNHRGHIATYKIAANKLFIKSIDIENKTFFPEKFFKRFSERLDDKSIFFNSFSGMIAIKVKDEEFLYFRIINGVIKEKQMCKGNIAQKLEPTENNRLQRMYKNYIIYFFRLGNDRVIYNSKVCDFDTGHYPLSLYLLPEKYFSIEESKLSDNIKRLLLEYKKQ